MGKEHRLAERRQAILSELHKSGRLTVETLSVSFGVSEVTIRQDLQALYEQNLLLRTRGGAMAIDSLPELSFDVRQQQNADKKARIGQAAAQLIRQGDSIVIDASTTALSIIPFLRHLPELTVITNSLKVAFALLRFPQVHVIMPGGSLRRDAVSLIEQPDEQIYRDLNVRIGFFGARGITIEQGLTDVNLEEARTKRKMLSICQTVVAVLDGSKWGQMALVTYASLDEIHQVITDESAPRGYVDAVRKRGMDVQIV